MMWTTFYIPRSIAEDTEENPGEAPEEETEPEAEIEWVAFNVDTLHITALGSDSILLNGDLNVEYASLPLQYTSETTSIVLEFPYSVKDTVTFTHTNSPYFVSMECGIEVRQLVTGLTHTKHAIDSINISNNETSRNATDNLRFYFRNAVN